MVKLRKPIIGITSAYEYEEDCTRCKTTVSVDYSKAVVAGGGIPIVLPVVEEKELIKEQIKLLDGLVLGGGNDLNPLLYGEDFKQGIKEVSSKRDEWEIYLLEEFLKTKKPILGICRGHQLINIFFGGTLFQDLKYVGEKVLKHRQDFHPELVTHRVKIIDEDNLIYKLFGKEIITNSFHHQVINKLGDKITPIAVTEDGVVEAIQIKDYPFLYGIQWHPEMMTARGNSKMKKIFEAFVEKCKS